MSTGGADGPYEPSAPWERAQRWADDTAGEAADAAAGEMADTGAPPPDSRADSRRRRREADDDTTRIPASDLIAALGTGRAADVSPEGAADVSPEGAADAAAPERGGVPGAGWRRTGRSVVAALAAVLLVVAGTAWVIKSRADATLAANHVSALDPNDTNIVSGAGQPPASAVTTAATGTQAQMPRGAENILILGSDTRAKASDAALGGANTDPGGSDVVMVVHLSADRSHVTVVSIPRDMYVAAPTCQAWDYRTGRVLDRPFTSPYTIWRINSAYAAGGPPCSVKAVQQLTGLRIDRMIVIDFTGFAAIVNALGGIDVDACRPIVDAQLGTVLPVAGEQHLDGVQALNLVRARKVKGDSTSDLARIRRQQKVLSTVLKQMTSAGVLLNPVKMDTVLQAVVSNVQTDNVTLDDLLRIAQSFRTLDASQVTFFTVPTIPDADGVALDAAPGAALIWQALQRDEPLPGEVIAPVIAPPTTTATDMTGMTASPTTAAATTPPPVTSLVTRLVTSTPTAPQLLSVAPRDVDLQVVNVAGRGGVANQAMDALVPLGFRLTGPDLLLVHGQDQRAITVQYSSGNRAAALTVAAAVPGATLTQQSGLGTKVRLMLGSSFDGTVRAVAVGAPVPAALSTTAPPELNTVVSTVVTTPPPAPATTAPSITGTVPTSARPTLATSDLTSVNAGNAGCL